MTRQHPTSLSARVQNSNLPCFSAPPPTPPPPCPMHKALTAMNAVQCTLFLAPPSPSHLFPYPLHLTHQAQCFPSLPDRNSKGRGQQQKWAFSSFSATALLHARLPYCAGMLLSSPGCTRLFGASPSLPQLLPHLCYLLPTCSWTVVRGGPRRFLGEIQPSWCLNVYSVSPHPLPLFPPSLPTWCARLCVSSICPITMSANEGSSFTAAANSPMV